MRAKTIKIPTFSELISKAPIEIVEVLKKCEKTLQGRIWHPEGNVFIHINIVYNRAKRTGDINMVLAAFFHDLGKAEATKFIPPEKYSAHGHENGSARLAEKYRSWIEEMGGNFDIVHYVVKNHMRAKNLHEMRPKKREAFMSEPLYPYVAAFTPFDDMQTDYSHDLDD